MRSARLCSCEHDSDCCTWFCANTPSSLWTVRTKLTHNPNVPTHQRKAYVQVKAPQCHRHGGTHQQFIMFIYCFTSVWGRWGGGHPPNKHRLHDSVTDSWSGTPCQPQQSCGKLQVIKSKNKSQIHCQGTGLFMLRVRPWILPFCQLQTHSYSNGSLYA